MAHIAGEYEVVLVAGSDGRLAADIRRWCASRSRDRRRTLAASANRARRAAAGAPTMDSSPTTLLRREYARAAVHQAVVNLDAQTGAGRAR